MSHLLIGFAQAVDLIDVAFIGRRTSGFQYIVGLLSVIVISVGFLELFLGFSRSLDLHRQVGECVSAVAQRTIILESSHLIDSGFKVAPLLRYHRAVCAHAGQQVVGLNKLFIFFVPALRSIQ